MGDPTGNGRHARLGLRAAAVLLLPLLLLAWTTGSAAAAQHHKALPCLLSGGSHARQSCATRQASGAGWGAWCRRTVSCASHHLYLNPRFGIQGAVGQQLKPLPEGKWIKRFVRVGWVYGISPRILMAIGLIESYGGTTSTAFMGCLRAETYGSWPDQIVCAAKVLRRYGLAGYDPDNPSYPSVIREHARGIIIRSR